MKKATMGWPEWLRVSLTLAVCLMLSACLDVQVRVTVHADGSGTGTWLMEIPPATAAMGINAELLKKELAKDKTFGRPGVSITDGKAANGNQTITVIVPFQNISEINDPKYRFAFETQPDKKRCVWKLKTAMSMVDPGAGRISVEVEMPGKIVASNADQFSGRVAHFTTLSRREEMYVESEMSQSALNDPRVIGGLAAGAVIGSIVFVFWRRRAALIDGRSAGERRGNIKADVCRKCGTQLREGARFCRKCGMELEGRFV